MTRHSIAAAVLGVAATLPLASGAHAHGVAGKRVFPTTLTIDDPAVADEASFPTVTRQRNGATDTSPPTRTTQYSFEYDKRITEHLGVAINDGYSMIQQLGQNNLHGWQNLNLTLKYQLPANAEHEFLMSVGVIREFGGTGAVNQGIADGIGTTTPTIYFGKGFGDLPDAVSWLKPLAVTGTFGYQFADVPTSTTTIVDPDSGIPSLQVSHKPDLLVMGASVQYSVPYLQANIKDLGLPEILGRITPLVEFAYTTPATTSNGQITQGMISPGLIYSGDSFQIGVEALIPATKGAGTNVGFIAQLHFFLDDIFPTTLGKPLLGF